MQPILDVTDSDEPILAIVAPVVRLDLRCCPVELLKRGEVDAVLAQVRLAFGLVPVPHLYAYIKLPGKGECGVGRVKVGLRGDLAWGGCNGEGKADWGGQSVRYPLKLVQTSIGMRAGNLDLPLLLSLKHIARQDEVRCVFDHTVDRMADDKLFHHLVLRYYT